MLLRQVLPPYLQQGNWRGSSGRYNGIFRATTAQIY